MSKRIIWFSTNQIPIPEQLRELNRIWPGSGKIIHADKAGPGVIIQREVWNSIKDLLDRFDDLEGDEMITVLPMSMISRLLGYNIHPIYAKMKREYRDYMPAMIEHTKNGITLRYNFIGFKRVIGITIDMIPLVPTPEKEVSRSGA